MFLFSCSEETVQTQVGSKGNVRELLKQDQSPDLNFVNTSISRLGTNIRVRSIANTSWDFFIVNNLISWHANVIFYSNGTTFYDEPAFPGEYSTYGTWSMNGNVLTYDLAGLGNTSGYYFTGTMIAHNMSGTYGTESAQLWSAVQY